MQQCQSIIQGRCNAWYARTLSPEGIAILLQVSKAKVWVEQAPWQRVDMDGETHKHGAVKTSQDFPLAEKQCHCLAVCFAWQGMLPLVAKY